MQTADMSFARGGSAPPSSPPDAALGIARRDSGVLHAIHLSLRFRRFTARHFAQLDAEFEALCPPEYQQALREEVLALRRCSERSPSWDLNHRLEFLMVAGLTEPLLRQRAIIHRNRLLALVGPEGSETFSIAFPTVDPKTDLPELRTQALGTLMEIQRVRNVRSEFERLRNRLIAISILPGVGFFALATAYAEIFPNLPLAAIAAIFGLFGGYLSSLVRVSSLRWSLANAANYQQVDRLFWNIFLNFYLCIIEGSLGAIVLYVVFSTEILSGSFFPTFPKLTNNPLLRASMLTHEIETRLMLWSLVAGFSERLVPDFLTGLSAEVTRTNGKSNAV